MSTLSVGAGKQYATLASAIAASHDGDVLAVQAGTYTNDFATINTKITIQGVGGMVNLVATVAPPDGKAILTTNTDVTIDHVAFSGAAVADGNGAGIRFQGGHLVLDYTYFHDNQDGVLAGTVPGGTITIRNSEFSHNGSGDGRTHNLYVGEVDSLTISDSYFHDAVLGHEIKSRAHATSITNSRIFDGSSTASYSVDLPNGGHAVLSGNVIEQGSNSGNPAIVHFGGEGAAYSESSLDITGNTVVNDLTSGSARLLLNQTEVIATVSNDTIWGLGSGQITTGPATVSGLAMLGSRPALDTSSPWATTTSNPVTGPETLVLHLSEDAYQGDALFTVALDGKQLGDMQAVTASHAAGAAQDFTFTGSFGTGPHTVAVRFLNDAWGGSADKDRNLYVDSLDYNGSHKVVGAALQKPDTVSVSVGDTSVANHVLVLHLSEDAYQGDTQFTVAVDGKQLGGTRTVTASHAAGATQDFTFSGLTAGPHTVAVSFLNDAWGGSADKDRNLYVDSLDFDGRYQAVGTTLFRPETATVTVAGTAAPASHSLVLSLSEDAWEGDAQCIVTVDGQQRGGVQTITASHAAGASQAVTVNGLTAGSHDVEVRFLNDAWGGTATTDRNLYVDAITYDGHLNTENHAALFRNETAAFHVDPWA